MTHQARKRFGQNFLVDEGVVESIVRAIAPASGENVVEIGPGLSALTQPLLRSLDRLTVIEIDRDLAARLRKTYPPDRLVVVEDDVLKVDFSALGDKLRIVGNLPYNISSPLLFHLMPYAGQVVDQHFMLQREVIDRMVAKPSSSDYSRLSVMLQSRYHMVKLFDVQPEAFDPPPRVVSAIVRMTPLPEDRPQPLSFHAFEQVVLKSFAQRRKMLRRGLAEWAGSIDWTGLGIPETARAEELSVAQFIALSDSLFAKGVLKG
ncbi:16S rRNA (adenine(1518)-N(6)/adenine(1519)-N(6))-dimethyltransferase RsmA [Eoetvoesiella caeni]|uniref:Ribosomal RNA small subunit methyltransferase A n=1 Tax=Eoetvoesiella caeni TaxID=645616 RepID=A0A366HC28_9BURK|nr:16S rRNA (adenine(1518)-N(6)/adenine(1519)-N(6))-dimethyltransferase RsmA [Eoetvoesiella caeni]MCI2809506.1 16S rRNA (adenine(1518)-N(6)/adenine(1519)-N(6))-dimethyltransferase RsmA [Eoetvoesiella caeni]NYT56002.1 16S rRNA (adenine(1518)-N(6)/adenine(1519)-N(6))-dimethyltransferase RsmA [Eoetvoesiella caeni]RBP38765.1 dimethyladenosine transferase [Eoetvoesiella caeni]